MSSLKIYEEVVVFDSQMVHDFAHIVGDTNPIHLDSNFASNTIFKKRIVHGAFSNAIFSRIIGTKLPGEGTIYLSQNTKFLFPIFLDEEYVARVEIQNEYLEKHRIELCTQIIRDSDKKMCVDGLAVVKNDSWFKP